MEEGNEPKKIKRTVCHSVLYIHRHTHTVLSPRTFLYYYYYYYYYALSVVPWMWEGYCFFPLVPFLVYTLYSHTARLVHVGK